MAGNRSSERGFSLIEVLVAGGVLCGAVVTLAALCLTSVGTMTAARHRSFALALAQAKLEELLAAADAGQPIADGSDALDADGRPTTASAAIYLRRWRFVAPPRPAAALTDCEVTVTTKAASGIQVGDVRLVTSMEHQP
jgi:Tfp pilus assembly protein PilV